MNQLFKILSVIVFLVLNGNCASLGKPDPLLPNAAYRCAQMTDNVAKEACNVGVLAERDRTIAAVEARPTYGSGYVGYTGGYVTPYNGGGYVRGYGGGHWSPTIINTPAINTTGGTVRGYNNNAPAPTPAPQKPGAPGVK